jgi:hypothetical protein
MKYYIHYLCIVFTLVIAQSSSRLQAQILPETTSDFLNVYKITGHVAAYQACTQAGAKVINFTADTSFATVWIPPNYATQAVKRVMVAIHGTKGSAYAAMNDEFTNAIANNYAITGIQWWQQGVTPMADGTYFNEDKIYRLIDTTLKHMKAKYGADLSRVGYSGFSRGSAASFLVMFYDRYYKTNYFALSVSASGGIPTPPNPPKPPLGEVLQKRYGAQPFLATSFFYYCGQKDEEWGANMCEQISYADSLIKANGGQTVRRISDPNGSHGGYRTSAGYQASAVQWFLDLTSTPQPPALRNPADKQAGMPLTTTLQWNTTATASLYEIQVSTKSDFSTTTLRDSLISASLQNKQISGLAMGTTYYWRVRSKNNVGASVWSNTRTFTTQGMTSIGGDKGKGIRDDSFSVSPNPAQERITVSFTLPQSERVSLKVFNILGQEIATILDESLLAGEHERSFAIGDWSLVSGTLFLQLKTQHLSLKTILLQVMR